MTEPDKKRHPKIKVSNLSFHYGKVEALKEIHMEIPIQKVTAIVGPSGCGKSTLIRVFNRIYDLYPGHIAKGKVVIDEQDILASNCDVSRLRARVGMVFQKPTPFPMTIFDNIAFGIKLYERLPRAEVSERVEWALRKAALWDEVKDKLKQSGERLSGGQQQRLCIARTIAVKPEVLLLDEPASSLDPISSSKIEELIGELKVEFTIVMVTHNMQQAGRISDLTAFMYLGGLIEMGPTEKMFSSPSETLTKDYMAGHFG